MAAHIDLQNIIKRLDMSVLLLEKAVFLKLQSF